MLNLLFMNKKPDNFTLIINEPNNPSLKPSSLELLILIKLIESKQTDQEQKTQTPIGNSSARIMRGPYSFLLFSYRTSARKVFKCDSGVMVCGHLSY